MSEETTAKKNILTYAGLKKLEDELTDLKVNKRREISKKIGEAREQGDLSENAEYDAAKDEQRDIEARIEEIEAILKHAEVFVEDEADTGAVNIGCKVKLYDCDFTLSRSGSRQYQCQFRLWRTGIGHSYWWPADLVFKCLYCKYAAQIGGLLVCVA